jgi:hypothetical protein
MCRHVLRRLGDLRVRIGELLACGGVGSNLRSGIPSES